MYMPCSNTYMVVQEDEMRLLWITVCMHLVNLQHLSPILMHLFTLLREEGETGEICDSLSLSMKPTSG